MRPTIRRVAYWKCTDCGAWFKGHGEHGTEMAEQAADEHECITRDGGIISTEFDGDLKVEP